MAYEEIDEPVEVITFFQDGKLYPLRFKWQGQVYKITSVNSRWSERIGLGRKIHFSVSANTPDCYELIFDTEDLAWNLKCVFLEG